MRSCGCSWVYEACRFSSSNSFLPWGSVSMWTLQKVATAMSWSTPTASWSTNKCPNIAVCEAQRKVKTEVGLWPDSLFTLLHRIPYPGTKAECDCHTACSIKHIVLLTVHKFAFKMCYFTKLLIWYQWLGRVWLGSFIAGLLVIHIEYILILTGHKQRKNLPQEWNAVLIQYSLSSMTAKTLSVTDAGKIA